MRIRTALILGALTVGVFVLPAAGVAEDQSTDGYVVQMLADPVVSYDGGVSGLPATKPGKGKKIDPSSGNVKKYAGYLEGQHANTANKGGADRYADYVYSFNGFAARMTANEAEAMKGAKGVVAVTPDTLQTMDTSSTPAFLGLSDKGGLWDQLGGVSKGGLNKGAGEDIVIGDIDSGIWPESKSFSDRKVDGSNGNLYPHKVTGYSGTCQTGEDWTASDCNNKIIGARYFDQAWGSGGAVATRPWEFQSPRDYNGHGTHTAGTAGGNYGTPTTGPSTVFGPVSGMAPRARLSVYKALWSTQDASTASGFNSDLVLAIDQAVADGVDVITYSISGTLTNYLDPVEVAFLGAADAGIFVSAAAGNEGPTASTVNHPAPWEMTVAAGTHNRSTSGTVTLGNNAVYTGASTSPAAVTAPIVNSADVAAAGANATAVALCFSRVTNGGTLPLDPAKTAGKIVVCDRGTNARTDKSLAVQQAGGVGMVLVNTNVNSLNGDLHSVPTVHLAVTDRAAVKAYAATTGATATISKAIFNYATPAPLTAPFSSRGPSQAGGDLLKPDVMAPGVDVLAAVSPSGSGGLEFNLLSGTSMATPHVAGVAALLKQLHPDWSPMAVKSALMTSGYDVLDGSPTDPSTLFAQGAGYIKPNGAADPGLVFDSGFNDWLAFLCGATTGVNPSACATLAGLGYSLDPSDLNVASISIGALGGIQTVTRKVTNVSGKAESYTASVTGLTGMSAAVSSVGSVNPGATKSFTVTFTQSSAAINTYSAGQLTLTGSRGHVVRIPIVIRPVALAAPAQVSGTGGAINYDVTFGFSGPFTATARGLVPATTSASTPIQDDPLDGGCTTTPSANNVLIPVTIAAGTTYARYSLFNANVTPASDLDLCVFQGTTLVGSSGSGTSAEEVNFSFANPTGGAIPLTVVVHGFAVPQGGASFTLFSWNLGTAAAGNMVVTAPATATVGGTGTINLTFSGLAAQTRYLGSVAYGAPASSTSPTIVRVDTP